MSKRWWIYGWAILLVAVAVPVALAQASPTRADDGAIGGNLASQLADPAAAPDFTLGMQPSTRTATQGQATTYTVTVTAQEGFSETVWLTAGGAPADAAAVLTTNPITPTDTSTLIVTTTATTPPGDYTLTITGTSASVTHTAQAVLHVLSTAPDFALIVAPEATTVLTGQLATYTVTVTALNDFTQPVNLAITGLPTGTMSSFSTNPVSPTGQSLLTVTTAITTPAGDYALAVTGNGGGISHTAVVTLMVRTPLETFLPLVLNNYQRLEAAFNFTPTTVVAGMPVSFTDQSTGGPTAWDWNFGDGSPHAVIQHPTHTYTSPGTFTVTLTVSNALQSDMTTQQVVVYPPLQAAFSFTPTIIVAGTPVSFTDQSTGGPTAWDWNFGDGSPHVAIQHPTHTYTTAGIFTVTLTVSNTLGSAVATGQVPVIAQGTELIVNGGFEVDAAWEFPNTPVPAAYTNTVAHSGQRSARMGIVPPAPDQYSYSSVMQRVTIPASAGRVTLSFWYWPRREGGTSTAGRPRALAQDAAGQSLEAWQATLAGDTQYAIVLDSNKNILRILMAITENASGWQQATFDLTAYKGRTIYVYFDVYNDGSTSDKRRTWMYVDNVSLLVTEADSTGTHWIDVDLSDQMLYAYEGSTPVRSTLVSTGVAAYPTPTGQFYIYAKYLYDDMSGPGYYLPNVPYVMYFYLGYAIHGTYWHNNFGYPMSHGCVNLPTPEAAWLYDWAPLGTLVNIHN